jgi:hypothetical protein
LEGEAGADSFPIKLNPGKFTTPGLRVKVGVVSWSRTGDTEKLARDAASKFPELTIWET